jgi:hypothetical protein
MNKYFMAILAVDRTERSKFTAKHIDITKQVNYTNKTIESLIVNGKFDNIKDDLYIYDDGSSSLEYLQSSLNKFPYLKVNASKEKRGIHPNTHRAWKDGLASEADWIITAQDDLVCSKNTFLQMDKWVSGAPKNTGVLSLWRPHIGGIHKGYGEWKAQNFWGCLFMIFPRKTLELYFSGKVYKHRRHNWRANDMTIKGFFMSEAKHLKIYGHSPCLVQHIGVKSTWCNPIHKRHTHYFKGEGSDATK